jgi:hypothetical protein
MSIIATTVLAALFGPATSGVDSASAKPGWKGGGAGPPGFGHGVKAGWRGAGQPPGWNRSRGLKRGWDRGGRRGARPPGLR